MKNPEEQRKYGREYDRENKAKDRRLAQSMREMSPEQLWDLLGLHPGGD